MNSWLNKKSNIEPKEQDLSKKDNKELALKGRFVVGASFLLFLNSQGLVKLNKLPFLGSSIESTDTQNITCVLIAVVFYAIYKYWVYKRIAELHTSTDILSKKLLDDYLKKKYEKIYRKAHLYLLSHGNMSGFEHEISPPNEDYNSIKLQKNEPYVSPYNINYWGVSYVSYKIPDGNLKLYNYDNQEWALQVATTFSYNVKGFVKGTQTGKIDYFTYQLRDYVKLKQKFDLLAHILLPDFIERTVPFLFAFIALITGFRSFL